MINLNHLLKYKYLIIILLFLSSLILFFGFSNFGIIFKFNLLLIFFLNIFPFIYISKNKNEEKLIPIFQLISIYYIICYTSFFIINFSGFSDESFSGAILKNFVPDDENIKKATYCYLVGLAFLNLGYFGSKIFVKTNLIRFNNLNIKNNLELLSVVFITNFVTLIFFYLIKIQNYYSAFSQLKFVFIYLTFSLTFLVIFDNTKVKILLKIFFIFLNIYYFYIEILKGSYAFPFLILIFLLTLYYHLKKKLPLIAICLTAVLFLFFHSFKHEYRILTWDISKHKEQSVNQSIKESNTRLLVNSSFDYIKKFSGISFDQKIKDFKNRNIFRIYHSAESLIIVTNFTPEEVPFWKGYSYKILLSKIIPRLLWKDKPSDTLGNDFGHRYKILNSEDQGTSWNMPVLNEFYVNYGLVGVLIGMLILGIILRICVSFVSIINTKNYHFVSGFAALFPIFFLESHLSLVFGTIIQTYIFSIIYFIILKKIIDLTTLKYK